MADLTDKKCVPCEGGVEPLSKEEALLFMQQLNNWHLSNDASQIEKIYNFKNFFRTMAYVNAIAYMASIENHHPDMEVSFNFCKIKYSTHAINGLSENDFICAAKADQLFAMQGDEQ